MNLGFIFVCSIPAVALILGLRERWWLQQKMSAITYRINVNGTRGKSTLTRLITAALLEAGIPTIGKVTGSKSCLLTFEKTETRLIAKEVEIIRRPEGPNIREIKVAIREAADKEAEVLVAECMAVNPEYQKVYIQSYLQSNINIITNVLDDHLEILGPQLEDNGGNRWLKC